MYFGLRFILPKIKYLKLCNSKNDKSKILTELQKTPFYTIFKQSLPPVIFPETSSNYKVETNHRTAEKKMIGNNGKFIFKVNCKDCLNEQDKSNWRRHEISLTHIYNSKQRMLNSYLNFCSFFVYNIYVNL